MGPASTPTTPCNRLEISLQSLTKGHDLTSESSDPIDPYSIVAIRIEGVFKEDPNTEMYDVGIYHRDCADKARELFLEIREEDDRVMAFEFDLRHWREPARCDLCGTNII